MRRWLIVTAGLVGIGAISTAAVVMLARRLPDVAISITPAGLKSIKVDDVEFLDGGNFTLEQVVLKKPSGETVDGQGVATEEVDPDHQTITKRYTWGTAKTTYSVDKNWLTLHITTTNLSPTDTIESVHYTPLYLKFPQKLKEYDGSIPLLVHNIGQVAAQVVSWDSGTLAVVSEDITKPLIVGFPWALDRPLSLRYPLSVHTGRVGSYPDSLPTINRPIPPKGSDTFTVSLRFGRSGTPESKLTDDVYTKFAETFPFQLKWTDHRPIGQIVLASTPGDWATNPRGWFGQANINVETPSGRADLRQRVLNLADGSIQVMHDMNAQGAVTWDPEGQEFASSASYIGDPRAVDVLAPEIGPILDEYFDRFIKAGLRVGVSVRPQRLQLSPDRKKAMEVPVDDPASLLIDKIAYAKKRWGATIFYLASNTNSTDPNPVDASVVQKVAAAFPDCLLIPEHSNLQYYAYSVPYMELRGGMLSTPSTVHRAYPNAFSVVYTVDGPLDLYRDSLVAAVKRGDSVMYRSWFADPQNEKVKALYPK